MKDRQLTISVEVVVYNQENYIRTTLLSLLNQDCGPYELVVSDDCSSDHSWEIINNVVRGYKGPIKIILNRNESNIGMMANWQKCVSLTHGSIVVAQDGDDYSAPNRLSKIIEAFSLDAAIQAVGSEYYRVTSSGDLLPANKNNHKEICVIDASTDVLKYYDSLNMLGATMAYKRSIFDNFPKFPANAKAGDVIAIRRAIITGKLAFISEPLVYYRIEGGVSKTRSSSIAQSIEFSRRRCLCVTQMLEDLQCVSFSGKDELTQRLKSRLATIELYIKSLSERWAFTRAFYALKYLSVQSESLKKRMFVLLTSAFPRGLSNWLFPLVYRKNLLPS